MDALNNAVSPSPVRACDWCEKQFVNFSGRAKFCGAKCRELAFAEKARAARRASPVYTRSCKGCGIEIATNDSRKVFCSAKCRYATFNALRPTTKALKRECPNCSALFVPMQKRGVGRTYCGVKCRDAAQRRRLRSHIHAKSWAYRKKSKWGGNWYRALERDEFTCQACRGRHTPGSWTKKRFLVVHHLDGSGEKDVKNHDLSNLMTVCNGCHHLFHSKINLVQIDGRWMVSGPIFASLGLTALSVQF